MHSTFSFRYNGTARSMERESKVEDEHETGDRPG